MTCCTNKRRPGLSEGGVPSELLSAAQRLESEGCWLLRSAVVMPDHVHLLVISGASTALATAMRLFKGRLTPTLRKSGLQWQPAYFDHRLRPGEDRMPIFLYMFLNPYRANLAHKDEKWPGYYCREEDWAWFGALTDRDTPTPEWLL